MRSFIKIAIVAVSIAAMTSCGEKKTEETSEVKTDSVTTATTDTVVTEAPAAMPDSMPADSVAK